MEKWIFEYGGKHFRPERHFRKNETFMVIAKHQRTDLELGFCEKGYAYPSKYPYTHESFYEAAKSDYDLFRCLENGKLYIPCEHDLQEYMEPERKTREAR